MRTQLYGNLQGSPGTQRTINVMKRLTREGRVDPTVIFLAQQIARKYDRKDFIGQARGIHKYVQEHIHYVKDPRGTEMVRSALWTMHYRAGDCDDQAVLVASLAEAIGFRTRFKAIKVDPNWPGEFSHVYTQIQIPTSGEWVTSDTIVPGVDVGWEAEDMFGSRTWEGLGSMSRYASLYGLGEDAPGPISLDPSSTTAAATKSSSSFWGSIGSALKETVVAGAKDVATGYMTKLKEQAGIATAKPAAQAVGGGGIPSWLLPVGVVAGVGGLILLVKRKR